MNSSPDNLLSLTTSRAASGAIARRRCSKRAARAAVLYSWLMGIAAASVCITAAHAGESGKDARLAFDCKAVHLPAQQDVARLFGTHNFNETYHARERLMQNVRSECRRGAYQVLVEADKGIGALVADAPGRPL